MTREMTKEEAKLILEEIHDAMYDGYMNILAGGGKPDTTLENDIEAYEVAIEALRKQIPQKPYLWGDGYADGHLVYDMWNCPNCEKTYEVDYDEYDHCPACGQAIDWSDTE